MRGDHSFLVWFADNLCALRIDNLMLEYNQANKSETGGITGMVAARKQRCEETGRVVLGNGNSQANVNSNNNVARIKLFIEKGVVTD